MAGHTSEKRWRTNQNSKFQNIGVSDLASSLCIQMLDVLTKARAGYLELQELYLYAGSSVQGIADQLFYEDWSARLVDPEIPDVYETQANAEELGKAQDLFDAMTALNEIHQAADNQVVAAEDRYSQLRRMS